VIDLPTEAEPVRVVEGDCLDVLPLEVAEPVYVVTDPPYGVTYQSNRTAGRGVKPITNDGTRHSLRLYRRVIPLLKAAHVLWFTRWDAWPDVWELLGQHYPIRGLLVWDKGSPGMGDLKHWGPSYELVASAGEGETDGKRDGSILRFNTVSGNGRSHPTQKPVELLAYLIEKIVPKGGLVLDPFLGSGTTALACLRTGRRCIGIESDTSYAAIARRRVAEALSTGLFAEAV
jgi:site-specific DNA-methyltransferase (adenine-specific)